MNEPASPSARFSRTEFGRVNPQGGLIREAKGCAAGWAGNDGTQNHERRPSILGFLLSNVASPREGKTEKEGQVDVTSLEELDYRYILMERDGLASRVGFTMGLVPEDLIVIMD